MDDLEGGEQGRGDGDHQQGAHQKQQIELDDGDTVVQDDLPEALHAGFLRELVPFRFLVELIVAKKHVIRSFPGLARLETGRRFSSVLTISYAGR